MSRKIIIVTAIVVFLLLRLSAQVPSLPRVTLKLADTTEKSHLQPRGFTIHMTGLEIESVE